MKKEKLKEVIENLKLPLNKWLDFDEIESIKLNNGKGVYPNWKHMRFLVKSNYQILIKHGDSIPYGGRLSLQYSKSFDGSSISISSKNPVPDCEYYSDFRLPKEGDVIRATEGFKVYGESLITKAVYASNAIHLSVIPNIICPETARFSFYDPKELTDKNNCMHSSIVEGIYMKFEGNIDNKKRNNYYEEIIKPKDIKEINLKIGSKYLNKTYKIE